MPSTWDLEIDTYWIRRAADSLGQASQVFATVGVDRLPLPASGLGPSETAAAVVALVNVRNDQAHAAATQLQAVSGAVGRRLGDAADHFDLVEAAIAMPPR